ncbi:alpha/beta hydrolase domain-containing protein [Devosia sp. YIM 151766]|uniref:alpha/beta hydrolase domain-containing protein n=1 Tax=Devosia sp. YIM 151766 TaxID=3017325 RepID=UPI00255CA463|nr:alpha/beta hydrolase domain-containing protein [Devosia sp. YIM 151766]WIY52716.1 alpha/beta hydrolase domain-containing protein [Devosia sp. YIM 151766]
MTQVISLDIRDRRPFAGGATFGETGSYELIVGRAELALRPDQIGADGVYEADFISKDDQGRIRATTDIWMLVPTDADRGNGSLLFEFVNRGNKRMLQFFNSGAASNHPSSASDAGNGFLMRQGFSLLIAAWQGDVLPGDHRVVIDLPGFSGPDERMTATITAELIHEGGPVATCLPLSGKTGTRSYPVADPETAVLVRRRYPHSRAEEIGRDRWSFSFLEGAGGGLGAGDVQGAEQAILPSERHIWLPEGFQPGWIYQLTYKASQPLAFDIGFVAVGELVSYLRHCTDAANPLAGRLRHTIGWGRSQSGRAIRDFLHRGFNRDHAGRRIFDGMLPHISGGGKTTMNRFQNLVIAASREYEDNLHPSDRFPFSYARSTDHLTGNTDAILKRPDTDPKLIHTQSASEYWHRRGSLVHTDTRGNDLEQPDNVRIYLWSSSQHWSDPKPSLPPKGMCLNYQNIVQTVAFFRSTLMLMHHWLAEGRTPPASRIPRRSDSSLVEVADYRFPAPRGLALPKQANPLHLVDYGPDFDAGHAAPAHPQVDRSQSYAVLVPQADSDGNDLAGLRAPMVEAPLGSYTGWNLRAQGHGAGMLHGFSGSYIPFAETPEEAELTDDPRPSIASRYTDASAYSLAIETAARALLADGFLLEEDVITAVDTAKHFGRVNHSHSLGWI